jgi:Leucine-rich repeat (LRR) protein
MIIFEITAQSRTFVVENSSNMESLLVGLRNNDSRYIDIDTLTFRYFKILMIPKEISKLKNIIYLKIIGCGINFVDEVIFELSTLKYLSLENNNIYKIPSSIERLNKLEYLYLGNSICHSCIVGRNSIKGLPIEIIKCKKLKYLNIINNNLDSIPEIIFYIKSLEILDFRANNIDCFPSTFIKNSVKIKDIYLQGNKIKKINNSISNFTSLEKLFLNHNFIENINLNLFEIKKIKFLDFSDNNIKNIPSEINRLKKIKTLILNNNNITHVGQLNLVNLETIEVCGNNLIDICASLTPSVNLRRIRINGNKIPDNEIQCLKTAFPVADIIY